VIRRLSTVLVAALLAGACSGGSTPSASGFEIVTAVAPIGEIARRVGGEAVTVTVLAPAEADAHDLEPGPREIEAIGRADLVLYIGGAFQPAIARAAAARPASARYDLLRNSPTIEDTHLWLNPEQMRIWTREIRDRLAQMLPEQRASIAENAGTFMEELLALDTEFRTGLRDCTHRTFVVMHAAFTELARRYELTEEALSGFEPEAEPDPASLERIVRVIKREGLTTVFTEPGAPSRVIDTVVRETGARPATLDPLEATAERSADTYLTRMRANLAALREGLGCR
jgi:zinc transport system substrate-binding protein